MAADTRSDESAPSRLNFRTSVESSSAQSDSKLITATGSRSRYRDSPFPGALIWRRSTTTRLMRNLEHVMSRGWDYCSLQMLINQSFASFFHHFLLILPSFRFSFADSVSRFPFAVVKRSASTTTTTRSLTSSYSRSSRLKPLKSLRSFSRSNCATIQLTQTAQNLSILTSTSTLCWLRSSLFPAKRAFARKTFIDWEPIDWVESIIVRPRPPRQMQLKA